MDTDQQVRLDFLVEAEEYFDSLESLFMDLDSQGAEPSLLDTAMRAAHSLKGGAAMMRFMPLSQVAHRLEDFLKILRVRKDDSLVDREVTTLLLQGVDCLREVRNLHQQQANIDEDWLTQHTASVFEPLRARLGDLKAEDEDLLLAEEEQVDVSTLIFQSGVEECLESFKTQIDVLEPEQLKAELAIQAEQLAEFGQMSLIEPFVQLCQSVQQQLEVVSLAEVKNLAQEALKLWERSHALVLVGRIDKLPTQLGSVTELSSVTETSNISQPDIIDIVDSAELAAIQDFTAKELASEPMALKSGFDFDEFIPDAAELLELDAAFDSMDKSISTSEVEDSNSTPLEAVVLDLDEFVPNAAELSELSSAFESISEPQAINTNFTPETSDTSATALPKLKQEPERMVKVPAEQLQRLNDLSSKLILERNAAILRLKQLQNFVGLTRERMRRLEQSSNQLRKLYDWASLEGMIPTAQPETLAVTVPWQPTSSLSTDEKFDALEMDRYTDLHLLSQEQMETIVQLQEVTTDIDLGIQEMGQVVRNLSYTTQELQQNVTRSQMRPFAELVKRFPRMIRDLANKHQKPVEIEIVGETTYIDRQALELLSDPLTHLLRNAFDHGIEDTATRLAAGKPAEGKIILKAAQKGNQTVITITDDGGGINTQKIRDRLLKVGFSLTEIEQISEPDLLETIFEPGFSTADQVTELSGRGVGMDVVRSNLLQIRGDIQVNTELGKGTTFIITVPLSLLVLRVVIVESAGMVFAIPVHSIKEIIKFDSETIINENKQEKISWNNQLISLIRLDKSLSFQRPSNPFEMEGIAKIQTPTVLIFEENTYLRGIYLEKYWTEQEVAIRPVKTSIPLFPGFTGSTVLGDGRVIPLIEPIALCKGIAKQQRASFSTLSTSNNNQKIFSSSFPVSEQNTVLIVDDSVNVRRYLAGILERNGYRVEGAKDGRDAVDKLLAGLQVKAIICDVEMPRLDGYGVLSEVKSEPNLEHIPIAMLTSRSNDKHRQLAMKLGASAYFSKPFNEQEMLQTLSSLIGSRSNLSIQIN
jgi:two-component system, chemotaxis family, sensor histidine kinase and response regulator PixL